MQKNYIILLAVLVITTLLNTSCSHLASRQEDEEKSKLHLQKAADLFNERQYGPAIEATLEAIKYDPNSAEAYNHLALIYMETKRFSKSEQAFTKALELRPDYPEVFNNFGVLLNRMERYPQAIHWFEKALKAETYPTPENAYTNMGYAYYRMGNNNKAKMAQQKALDLSPQFCLANKNMGDIYAKEKNFAKAVDLFQKATVNCPLYQEAHYKLGLALMKMGQRQVAKAQFEKIIERHKTGPYVDRSSEVLKYLK